MVSSTINPVPPPHPRKENFLLRLVILVALTFLIAIGFKEIDALNKLSDRKSR